MKIGEYPTWPVAAARKRAQELKREIDRGNDPLAKRQEERAAPTLRDLFDRYSHVYFEGRAKSYVKDQRRYWKVWILPELGSTRLRDLTQEDVLILRRKMVKDDGKGKVSSNQMFRTLRAALNKAVEWQWIERNPANGIKEYHEEPRERPLTPPEFKRLWQELEKREGNGAADAIRFIALTGCRKGEALTATINDFNEDLTEWIIPARKTKQRRRHPKPLADESRSLLLKRFGLDDYYAFVSSKGRPLLDVKHVWNSVRKDAGIEDVTIHDLRHTIASYMVSTGTSLFVVGKVLGHTQERTTRRYAHLHRQRLAEETQRYANAIKHMTTETETNQ